jgi:NAD(P)-dependent dehydrogenase (short-subunit alcohol dehydrogenase family)
MRFSKRTIIVTGGGFGIGRAISLGFGREGANVVLASRSKPNLEAVAAELRALGTDPTVAPLDVRDEAAVESMVKASEERYGSIDVLVNNSGISGPTALVSEITAEGWRETLEVNLTGAFLCAKHVARGMIARNRGAIVNISSIAGRIGYALRSPYAASKWGMIGFSHSLAAELGPHGIRVNAVLPGPTQGKRVEDVIAARARAQGQSIEETMKFFTRDLPLGRMVTEDEVASAVLFLASDDAETITGQALNVDSGFRMQ